MIGVLTVDLDNDTLPLFGVRVIAPIEPLNALQLRPVFYYAWHMVDDDTGPPEPFPFHPDFSRPLIPAAIAKQVRLMPLLIREIGDRRREPEPTQ